VSDPAARLRQSSEPSVSGTDVRNAVTGDVGTVIDILSESSRWVASKGINQWPDRFPRDLLIRSIERDELFVADSGRHTVGTITLQWSDPTFWGPRADAAFVHRLAVRRGHPGLGVALMEWAESKAVEHGRRYLCLDCMTTNSRLRRYYEDLGFRSVGEITGPSDHPHTDAHGWWRATLYEKALPDH
jgi:GNAT superfamily N-acetyltransferase